MTIASAASAYLAAGLSVLPACLARKRPELGSWKDYQQRLPTTHEITAWFANTHDACCIICGTVSGHLELIDFDCAGESFTAWSQLVTAEAPGLLDRLVVETSPSGGWHVVYRCTEPVSGNLKLAQRREDLAGRADLAGRDLAGRADVTRYGKGYKPRRDNEGRWHITLTMIETRGEGGLFLCAPTAGYQLVQGDFTTLPVLTAPEREVLLRCAWALNQVLPEVHDPQPTTPAGLRPGDDFNRRADVADLLRRHGWSLFRDGANQHWCRPGKTQATSATLKNGVLYVFSSNAQPFEPNRAYSPFAAFALLEHGGDYAAAAATLRGLGFGQPPANDGPGPPSPLASPPMVNPAPAPICPGPGFDLRTFAQTPHTEVDWIWPGVIPRRMLSLIGGKQGLGKSFLICDLAARISAGKPMPDGLSNPPGKVLLLAREDDASCVLLPRLVAAGAELHNVSWSTFSHAETQAPLDLVTHVQLLTDAVADHDFDLIVVDTFAAFAPIGTDANAAQDVRLLLDALTRLARQSGAAVLVVAHLRKNGPGDGDAMDAIAGSAQMTAGVRVAALLDKGIQDDERWFRVVKSNLGRIDTQGWTWRFAYPDPFGKNPSRMPHLEWKLASGGYATLAAERQAGRVSVDPAEVRTAVCELVAKGPMTLRVATDRTWARLRIKHPGLRKMDLEEPVADLFREPGEGLVVGEGDKGGRIIGKPGCLPERPEGVAYRLAKADPGLSVRRLRELAGCRKDTAMEILREVRTQMQECPP